MYLINFIDIQEAIWNAVNSITEYTVVDYIEYDSIEPPFIRLGNLYFNDNSVKNNEGLKAQQYINIYSTYSGKKEIIEMMDRVNEAMLTIKNIGAYTVRIKQRRMSLSIDKDNMQSVFRPMERGDNNKFYHAVLSYDIYIN